jgi:hypothetical protein
MLNHAIRQDGTTLSGTDFSYRYNTTNKNNHGTAVMGTSTKSNTLGTEGFNDQPVSVFNSTPVQGTTNGLSNVKAISGGVFAHNHVKPVSPYITSELANVNRTSVISPASVPALTRSIAYNETVTTDLTATAFRAGFNLFTGRYINSPGSQSDAFGNDTAARASRATPGQLVYQIGGQVPQTNNYKTKTS